METPAEFKKYKEAVFDQFSRIGKAVSSPKRLEILELLSQAPRTVEALAKLANLTIANTSRHLHILRNSGLVESKKSGLYVEYRIADIAVCDFLRNMRLLAERRLADLERISRDFQDGVEDFEPVDREQLLERVRKGETVVIDVRPEEEYRAGHIPGARSIPLKELESRIAEIPADSRIVAYCRGPYCLLAMQAVKMLRSRGFNAVRLDDGIHDWRAHGHEVERKA